MALLRMATALLIWQALAVAGDVSCPGEACSTGGDGIVDGTVNFQDPADNPVTGQKIIDGTTGFRIW